MEPIYIIIAAAILVLTGLLWAGSPDTKVSAVARRAVTGEVCRATATLWTPPPRCGRAHR